ncbi:MAG: BrxA/BrxB family bacilliredoxin [Chitinophagales bacterium]|nr:BrxA/BrxB family bacilliredoxin [Chitinophagales bacterium]MDW8419840.1 BrxA/BrxB family bacilliredoxin [Chitinophagales bacterium]
MYPPELVAPMKADLTSVGFEELLTPDAVDAALKQSGTVFLVFNSVCGCAAGAARPAVRDAIRNAKKRPDKLVTVFAGVDREAVNRAREYTLPYPPSSPSMALFKDGKLVHFIERHQIEGNSAETISAHLQKVFEHYC